MSRFVLFFSVLSAVALSACESVSEMQVPEGTFVLSGLSESEEDLSGLGVVTMIIDREALTVTIELEDGSEQVADLLLRDRSEWEADCYTMSSHALTEVYDVDTDSLSLGSVEVELPVLTAKCGGRPLLGSDGGAETFEGPVYVFDQAS